MRQWGLFNLEEQRRLVRDLISISNYLTGGGYREDGARLFSMSMNKMTRNNGHNLQQWKFWSDRRKICFTMRALSMASTCHAWLEKVWNLIRRVHKKSTFDSSSAWSRRSDERVPDVRCNLNYSSVLRNHCEETLNKGFCPAGYSSLYLFSDNKYFRLKSRQ